MTKPKKLPTKGKANRQPMMTSATNARLKQQSSAPAYLRKKSRGR